MKYFGETIRNSQGLALAGALVSVTVHSSGLAASLTDDNGDAIANPIVSDAYGRYEFNVDNGVYDLMIQTRYATYVLQSVEISAYDEPALAAIGALVPAADTVPYFTGVATAALAAFTAFGRTLVACSTAALARTALGLGSMAIQDASAVAITGGTINGATIGATVPAAVKATSITNTGLTSGRIPVVSTAGLIVDFSTLLYASVTGLTAEKFVSTVTTGTAPLTVASTTMVANLYGARAALADTVTTNANLTGVITSSGNATSIASQTGTGTKFVVDNTPTLITPVIGVASGTSVTLSGLTSGRLPLIGTSGLINDSANLTYTSGTPSIQIGANGNVNTAVLALNSIAGQNRSLTFSSGGLLRAGLRVSSTAEGGSDTGSNVILSVYDDSGALIDAPLSIVRAATGAMTFTRVTILPNGGAAAPSLVFSSIQTTGLYRAAASIGFSAAGVSIGTWGAAGLTVAALTSGRVPFASTAGLIIDASTFTYTAGSGISVDGITVADGKNVVFNTSTGSMLGTANTQKLSLWGVTPVVQYSTTGTTAGFTTNVATNIKSDSTFTGNTGSTAYTVGDIVRALKLCGIMLA